MKQRTRTALGIGVLITLVAALGAGLFVTGNSQVGVYVVVGGIPLLLLAGAVAYVRGVVGGQGNTGQFVEQRAKQVGGSLRDVWRSLTAIEERYPRFDASTLRTRAESLAADYESEGGDFDRDSGSFSVGRDAAGAELQELERIADELDALAADRDDELHAFVRDELDALEANLRSLADAGLATEPPAPRSPPTPADGGPSGVDYHDAVGEPLDAYREDADEMVADAIARVREIRRSATGPIDEEAVESRLDAADAARADGDYATAVDDVLEARSELESELSGSFDQDRSALLSLADAVLESDADRFVAVDPFDTVREVQRELEGLDSALDVEALTRHRRSMREATREIVTSLESSLADAVNALAGEDLPAGYYTRPEAADVDYASELEAAESIEDLEAAWRDAADALVPAVDTVETKATVVEAYPDVSETIEETLRRSGTVTADDLPVRHAEQFFGLYFRRNPSVEFDPDAPAIHRGDVETYAVTVTVSFDEGSEDKRTAVVELTNEGFDASEVVETHLVGDAAFADVPAGEYDVTVRPREDGYPTVEQTVTVEGDTSVSVDVEPVGLYEELVGDREAEMREHAAEFGPRLAERFEEDGYLHTDEEYPIADEYVPGLLAAWADEQGYDLARADGTVYVYDPDQLSQEIMNVIKYNIDDGEAITYDRVRSNFLSTPVPDEVIAALATDTTLAVTATDDGLEKPAGGEE
jgi:hypothetical protein